MAGFRDGALDQPSDAGSVLWLVQSNNGWVTVNPAWVDRLEAKVAEGPPYAGDIYPPVHKGKWKPGSTQYTLNVATMTRKSDNKQGTVRPLMRVIVEPPPGARATQGAAGGGGDGGNGDGNGEGGDGGCAHAAQAGAEGEGGTRATQGGAEEAEADEHAGAAAGGSEISTGSAREWWSKAWPWKDEP